MYFFLFNLKDKLTIFTLKEYFNYMFNPMFKPILIDIFFLILNIYYIRTFLHMILYYIHWIHENVLTKMKFVDFNFAIKLTILKEKF